MDDETKLLMRWLRHDELILNGLRGSEGSPFRDAAAEMIERDIARVKAQVFDALRATIEELEGGR